MILEDIQIALCDMYDLRTLLSAQRGVPLAPQESEETIGGCIDGVIQLLEILFIQIELKGSLSAQPRR